MLSGVYRFPAMESVIFGKPFAEALAQEVDRIEARAVFILASGTLDRTTDTVDRLRQMLGNRLAGVCAKIGAHTRRPEVKAPGVRSIAIPTTLSAGEYTASAGCTDTARHVKESYGHPLMMPRTVILDPDVSAHTPEWLFLSTGIRAVDHAVEDICSINGQPIAEGASFQALRLLGSGLPAVKADPTNLEARLDCQIGAWMSMVGSQTGVSKGASHGIGHVLGGTAGVPHGYTSCVMLPHV